MAGSTVDAEARDEEAFVEETPQGVPEVLIEAPAVEFVPDDRVDEPHAPQQPTPEQEEIVRLRDQLAKLSGKRDDGEPELEKLANPGDGGNIVIHFLEDGLTALGKVWYRGQELEFEPGSKAYKDTFNRHGKTWLELAGNDFAQVDRWGKVMFRLGPWPGKAYVDGSFEPMRNEKDDSRVRPPTPEELAAADRLRRTQRAAPRLPQQV